MTKVKPIPSGFHSLTPHLVVKDAKQAIDFYKKAFDAQEMVCMLLPDGKVMHAQLKIGDSFLMLADEMRHQSPQTLGGTPVTIHLYVEDADKVFNRAVECGASVILPINNMFWGDRYGVLADPSGHHWAIATHIEDLTPEQIKKNQEQFAAQMCNAKS